MRRVRGLGRDPSLGNQGTKRNGETQAQDWGTRDVGWRWRTRNGTEGSGNGNPGLGLGCGNRRWWVKARDRGNPRQRLRVMD